MQPWVGLLYTIEIHCTTVWTCVCILTLTKRVFVYHRVILALPAVMLVTVKTGGGKRTLDCETLMEHINQYQVRHNGGWEREVRLMNHSFKQIYCSYSLCESIRSSLLILTKPPTIDAFSQIWSLSLYNISLCIRGRAVPQLDCCPTTSQHTS